MSTRPPTRRGSVYVLVIITMAGVGAVVLSSLRIARGRDDDGRLVTDSFQAAQYARSAIEAGLDTINSDPTWRWTNGDGVWRSGVATDRGTLSLSVTGGDGAALGPDAWQPAKLTATGRVDLSRSILEVQVGLQGQGVPDIGEVVFGNGGLAYWALEGDATEAAVERAQGNAATLVDDAQPFRAGAVPGLGAASAPWIAGGAYARIDLAAGYSGIRTISFWFWADGVTATQGLVNRDALGILGGSWSIFLQGGSLCGEVEALGGSATASTPVTPGAWHHAVLTLEDTRGVLYVDGLAVDSTASRGLNYWDASLNAQEIYVGGSHSALAIGSGGIDNPFTGSICHLSLMSQPLTASEVKRLHDGYPPPAGYRVLADTWNRATN